MKNGQGAGRSTNTPSVSGASATDRGEDNRRGEGRRRWALWLGGSRRESKGGLGRQRRMCQHPHQGWESSEGPLGELRVPILRVTLCPANWVVYCAGPGWTRGAGISDARKTEAGEDPGSGPADFSPGVP